DLVEGGATSPSSIYGLATKVGFSLLPDLFFRTHVFEPEEVGKIVQQLKFNEKVKEVLARKLRAYAGWRKTTYQTLSHRRNFMVKYLRQHYNAIKLNMQWLKPYLKTMQRLEQKPGAERKPDLIAAVEQAFMEIELFATIKKFGKYNAITDVNFTFRTNPEMMYDAQMQYRKPSHTGRIDMSFKSRVMTDDQVAAYRILIEEEDFELLKSISSSIEEAMDALGDDLKKYLEEAGEKFEKPEPKTKEEKSKITVAEPFVEVFRGFKEIGKSFGIRKPEFKEKKTKFFEDWESDNNFKEAVKTATGRTFTIYWVYKKSHRMVTW
ncbi:hypothetical protein KY316_01830, partial [Candidatus Woesearchaeota archaeon]|nr:hypothetical protein [Candidatus Woesearchaeota archaeon]